VQRAGRRQAAEDPGHGLPEAAEQLDQPMNGPARRILGVRRAEVGMAVQPAFADGQEEEGPARASIAVQLATAGAPSITNRQLTCPT
jgi:hypothetical protein